MICDCDYSWTSSRRFFFHCSVDIIFRYFCDQLTHSGIFEIVYFIVTDEALLASLVR